MKFKTNFKKNFTIADKLGKTAIKKTFEKEFKTWQKNVEYITELCIVLNWKIWEHFNEGRYDFARLYTKLWERVDVWCQKNLKGKNLKYFYDMTD